MLRNNEENGDYERGMSVVRKAIVMRSRALEKKRKKKDYHRDLEEKSRRGKFGYKSVRMHGIIPPKLANI